ncbi:MCE family protein [[Mycobacterium] nativiensis]|uniref:MCE family protein n=1 Tax=[Mycobacterium] nativiensis TaxID=2855503 RepID=A0ABU5Y1D0_9MYCO|nr:MCE family protein [Mycolicibacter sp. MYC340]MEB3034052.1 MCE family protein [Mycolicibacter sp. MYC340]
MTLLNTSAESEARLLAKVGAVVVLSVVIATILYLVAEPFTGKPVDQISVAIETPYVGQGVVKGTSVIMHGVKVGQVTAISSRPGGGVRLQTDLHAAPIAGLTDTMGVDFRPANYFGVTGINLIPGENGQPLRDGASVSATPAGNFTLQAMLYRLGQLSHQVINQRLISVVERGTRYTDALNPLLETMITVATSVTDVQTASTQRLLRNTTGITIAIPGLIDGLINTGDLFLHSKEGVGFNADEDAKSNPYLSSYDDTLLEYYNTTRMLVESDPDKVAFGRLDEFLAGAEEDLFYPIGKLEGSHIYELYPVVEEARILVDLVPQLIRPPEIADTLRELRSRLERMYAGSGDQRALQLRIILDELPGVAAPLSLALGGAG